MLCIVTSHGCNLNLIINWIKNFLRNTYTCNIKAFSTSTQIRLTCWRHVVSLCSHPRVAFAEHAGEWAALNSHTAPPKQAVIQVRFSLMLGYLGYTSEHWRRRLTSMLTSCSSVSMRKILMMSSDGPWRKRSQSGRSELASFFLSLKYRHLHSVCELIWTCLNLSLK